jgi:hypothetical protein
MANFEVRYSRGTSNSTSGVMIKANSASEAKQLFKNKGSTYKDCKIVAVVPK